MTKDKIYFPNLNGLKCIAAFLVIIPHIEEFKPIYRINNYLGVVKTEVGHLSVVLFFVLSGFLITYLLLIEEKTTNNINIKNMASVFSYHNFSTFYIAKFFIIYGARL